MSIICLLFLNRFESLLFGALLLHSILALGILILSLLLHVNSFSDLGADFVEDWSYLLIDLIFLFFLL